MTTTVIILWVHFRDFWDWFLDGVERKHQKRMAEMEVEKCLDWILEQKASLECSGLGGNRSAVGEAQGMLSERRKKLVEYRATLDKMNKKHALTDAEISAMYDSYQSVQRIADKRSECIQVMGSIAALEEQIQSLSTEVDLKAVHLVNMNLNNRKSPSNGGLTNEGMALSTQNCISGVRRTWQWVDEMMQCAHVHLANASAYHEFFLEVEEVDYWLQATMSTMHLSFARNRLAGNRSNLDEISEEMKDTMLAYLRWQSKVDTLFTRARDIVPVHKRTTALTNPCPVLALATYSTQQIQFTEGETLTLLDNSDRSRWRVRNSRDQEDVVPAAIVLINGPSGEAIDAAVRLRLQLLGLWTTSIKRLGYQMIAFMQLVFKDWNQDEIKAIQKMPRASREELLRILATIDTTLQKNWRGYPGFEDLQEKMSRLRTILEEAPESAEKSSSTSGEVVIQVRMLENLLSSYQEFWTYWETYKVVAELLRQPKYILVCDNWQQLKYTTTAHYVRFWDTNLQLPQGDGKTYKAEAALILQEVPRERKRDEPDGEDEVKEEILETLERSLEAAPVAVATLNGEDEEWSSTTEITETKRRQEVNADEVMQSTEEVRHTYVIKSVYDPRTQDDISLTEAVLAGIIDQAAGRYVNILTGKSVSFQEAMAQGDITVEFKSQKKIKEERSSYGIITIKTSKETRPYTITSVLDMRTEQEMKPEEAYDRGILSSTAPMYRTDTGEEITILDAIQSGLVRANFHGKEADDDEEETKTYAVNGVINQRTKEKVSFHEALTSGILNATEGVYINNETYERVPIMEAIMKGLIKAKIITDTSKLNIDPTNKIVVQRLNTVKEKIIKAVRVTRAFKTKESGANGK
ncbi:desmoplakin-like isoform X2 [Dreissena polymorpha]|uniref:SH3 domain-containing protein n=1 Tax=Dreissena polymorpha TaxID=45954 RepID=A0A9D4JES6_DREPO|nr:desmoplakin-like isoform X2 [Dreissena polymorpha]KAH3805998.1 hypothetical protein DPMN_134308 [Dreissena polymorpha]